MNEIKKNTIRGIKWSAIERFSVQIVQFIIGLILARILSPADFGLIGMLTIFIALSQSIIDSGFSNALIRKIDRTDIDFSTAFYSNIFIGIICYLSLFVAAPYVAIFYKMPTLKDILRVLAINLFINSLTVVQIARLSIAINFKIQAKINLFAAIVSGIIGIVFAYNNFGVWSLVYQSVSSTLISAILLWTFSGWKPLWKFSWNSFHNLFSYGSKLLAAGILGTIYANMATLLIGKFYTSKELGYYTRGYQFATLPSSNITAILGRVTFPIFSQLQNDNNQLTIVYRNYICMTSMLIFFAMTLLATIARPLILILLTAKWENSIIFLQIFSFGMMFNHINQINLNLLQVKGRSDLFLKLEIIKRIISFTILFISIPLGVIAICLSMVFYGQIAIIINTYYTGRFFHLGYFSQIKYFSKYFIYSVISCIPGFIISSTGNKYLLNIIISILISGLLYYIFLRKDKYMKEFISTIFSKTTKAL